VIRNQSQQLRRSLRGLEHEGFRHVHIFSTPEEIDSLLIERQPLWNNLQHEHGPFDIIGDVHGCFDELTTLFRQIGYAVDDGDTYRVSPPNGRKALSSAIWWTVDQRWSSVLLGRHARARIPRPRSSGGGGNGHLG
jgi:protein phosphatase